MSCSEGRSGQNGPSARMTLPNPHVEETGEMVGYILFSLWKGPCLACGKQMFEG